MQLNKLTERIKQKKEEDKSLNIFTKISYDKKENEPKNIISNDISKENSDTTKDKKTNEIGLISDKELTLMQEENIENKNQNKSKDSIKTIYKKSEKKSDLINEINRKQKELKFQQDLQDKIDKEKMNFQSIFLVNNSEDSIFSNNNLKEKKLQIIIACKGFKLLMIKK